MATFTDVEGTETSFSDIAAQDRGMIILAEDGEELLAEDGVAIAAEDDDWITDTAGTEISFTDTEGG